MQSLSLPQSYLPSSNLTRDSDVSITRAEVALSGNNLVVVLGSELESSPGPSIEVGTHINRSAAALVLADRPELLEGGGTVNGGLVGTGADENVVVGAIDVDGAPLLGAAGWVVGAEVLDNVVLDQRPASPAVDGKIAVSIGLVGAGVGDSPESIHVNKRSYMEVYWEF